MRIIDSTWTRKDLLDEIRRIRDISELQSKHLAEALKEKNDLVHRLECHDQTASGWRKQVDDLQARYDELARRMGENLYYDLGRYFVAPQTLIEPAKPKFRVGQFVMALDHNPKWDPTFPSTNKEPYRIDKAVVRITRAIPVGKPSALSSDFYFSHDGVQGNYSIPEVWFRALRPEEI